MGNFLALCTIGDMQCKEALLKEKRMLQIVKDDGKILEFRSQVIVKDLLVSYPNYYVGIFKEATQPLPLNHKLKVGKMYYLLPLVVDQHIRATTDKDIEDARRESDQRTTKTTIKVVITKEQLKQILRKQGTVEELLLGVGNDSNKKCSSSDHGCCCCSSSSTNWFPNLESIPEGSSDVVC